ncbi:mechanosensitive ion channel family protein [Novosphingobium capsulatum]|uniref:mechanosensitive ion channel family protein n=1 Tax=Novosphingobium capsulatum TaxID=13688 RepID=UPI000786FD2E|nr:mechanosensitive ion channel family protein [Novosphingobium capsulatum]WQD94610.1 mechanosensitive ion channel family protein [Novosphingobium capsulatum]
MLIVRLFRFALIALLLGFAPLAHAQLTPAAASSPVAPSDPYGRETPRSAVAGLIQALAGRDYERAAHFMSVRLDNPRLANGAEELARRLQVLLDKGGALRAFGALSNDAVGDLNDDLPFNREQVGTMRVGDQKVPVLLASSQQGQVVVWRVAPETLQILAKADVPRDAPVASNNPDSWMVGGAPIGDWALLLGLAAASFAAFRLLAALILLVVRRLIPQFQDSAVYRFLAAALPPLSLFLSIMIFFMWANRLPVAIVARQTLLRYGGTVGLVALVWFALRLIDAIAELATRRLRHHQRRQVISVVNLLRRGAKLLLLAFTVVGVLDTFGINVTTGIAALGIGGIALALGAQKTVENLVGSVTVIADQPVQVGDFCKVGDVSGTVEDVGIRSTRIRTNDRTLVTIPNGDFAARQIENFATRDRFLFNPTIGIAYGLPVAKVREAVDIVRQTLLDHDGVLNDGVRATFTNFADTALTIDVWSYLAGPDYNAAMAVRQDVLLTIMEQFEAAGIVLAQPTRSVMVQGGMPLPAAEVPPSAA